MKKVESQLEAYCFHVRPLQGGSDVHMHVEEVAHHSILLRLLNLQLRQELDKPLEGFLVSIDPKEVHLKMNDDKL